MTLVPLVTLLKHAQKHQYAIPAFNISFQEQAQAVLDAADETQTPVIIQFSKGGLKHASPWLLKGLLEQIKSSPLPICLHRDHCHTLEEVAEAISLGFSSIMMDGTLTEDGKPNNLEQNIQITNKAIQMVKGKSISIEAEIGCLGSLETGLSGEEDGSGACGKLTTSQMLTDPQEAFKFIHATQAHCLAIAIGTSHGAYKFQKPPTGAVLDINRVKDIQKVIPSTPLVLHGSSSVSLEHIQAINQHGGMIKETYGVPVVAIQEAIQHGVAKVNIDTDLRLACTMAVRKSMNTNRDNFDPRGYLKAAYHAMKAVCIDRYQAFGSAGKAQLFCEEHETHTA